MQSAPGSFELIHVGEVDEVSRAAAVRGAEPVWMAPSTVGQQRRPAAFFLVAARCPPDLLNEGGASQRVDVPMPTFLGRRFEVPLHSGAQTAGSTGAADIKIHARREVDAPQISDLQVLCSIQFQDQDVVTRLVGRRRGRR
jgi:hypothetical protein